MKQLATTLLVRDASPAATEFTAEVVSDYQAFLDLEPDWNNLLQGAGIDHPFLTHEWVRTWWQCFGAGKTLHVIAVQRGGKLVAIAPMMLSKERIYGLNVRLLEFIYNKYTERFDFIVARHAPEAYRQIWRSVVSQRHLWDVIRLCQLPPGSRTLEEIPKLASEDGFLTGLWHSGDVPYLRLAGSWDSYFQSLRSKRRSNLRRRLKGLKRLGPVAHEVVRSGDRLETDLEEGMRIEAASWKGDEGTAICCSPEVREFYKRMAEIAAQRGWLLLDFLTLNGRRIAFDYCLCFGGKQYLLKTSYDPLFASYSPYHLLFSMVLQRAFEAGLEEFDFLGINDAWKLEWASEVSPHQWLYVFPHAFRARLIYRVKFGIVPWLKGLRTQNRRSRTEETEDRGSKIEDRETED